MEINGSKRILKKFLKWFLISVATLIASFIIFAVIIASFYQDDVKKIILKEINKNLRTEIIVDKIDLSLLRKFPYATITFHNILAKDAIDKKQKDTLLFANKLNLSFNIIDIFKENYKIKVIDLINAKIHLKIYNDNTNNYTFWIEDTDSVDTQFKLELKKINCKNVHITYKDAPLKQYYDFIIEGGSLNGKFNDEIFSASADATMFVNKIRTDNLTFLVEKHTNISLNLLVDNAKKSYNIKNGQLSLGNMKFDINGDIITAEATHLDLNIKGNNINLQQFIEEFPDTLKNALNDYKSKGTISFTSHIKGYAGANVTPSVTATAQMHKGTFIYIKNDIALSDISFKASFTNGHKQNLTTCSVNLENFKASLKQGTINGNFYIENFDSPNIKLEAKANLNNSELIKFSGLDIFTDISGLLYVDVKFEGKTETLTSFNPETFRKSTCFGKAELKNTAFTLQNNNKKFNNINGQFQFSNNDIIIDKLSINTEQSDFNLTGYFRNALSYIFIPNEKLVVDAKVKANNILMNELLTSNAKNKDAPYNFTFPEFLDFNIDFDAKKVTFEKFEAKNLNGIIKLKNKIFNTDNLCLDAFDGRVNISGTIDGRLEKMFLAKTKIILKKTDINKMFYQLENFGQSELIDKNLKGVLTTDIDLIFKFNNELNIALPDIYAFADITIENGELINYAPMNELSKFIRVDDLSHIKFEKLSNRIEIKNQVINIPNMIIKSNAINIEAMGTHTFDNVIDYRIKLLLSELLGKKAKQAKKENEEFGVVENDGLGRTTLFLKISGTIDNPKVTYDTKGVYEKNKNAIKEDLKNTFHKIGEELFKKNDTIIGIETIKQKEKKKKKKENEIQDDFRVE